MESILQEYGLYAVGAISVLGGFELARWCFPDAPKSSALDAFDPSARAEKALDSANIGISLGIALIIFGILAIYGGYQGWTVNEVISTAGSWFSDSSDWF
ncbi:MAG: hypothetical protein K8F91_27125 [Candidatus Obscuribacterales bacterium]|nr:hypothetical protein [Candidatus Obscuribacterales bacterium]